MALHVAGHVEQLVSQFACLDAVLSPLLVVEEQRAQVLCIQLLTELAFHLTTNGSCLLSHALDERVARLVQVVLQRLTHVVVYACRGIGSSQLLTLGSHRQDAAYHHRRAGIDRYTLLLENLREILGHAPSYAVMLTFANAGEVAQSLDG